MDLDEKIAVPTKASGATKSIEETYQKKTQLEHILIRPDTYVGSIESQTTNTWVYEDDRMVFRNVTFVPGLYKIFDEIIVNAADNKVRDPAMDTLKVKIDKENNCISVYNNGRGIPIEMHAKEKVYVPELIFGHLLTSSNYDDDEKKITGGRNGFGAKLCNIFSTEFVVETADSATGRKFIQIHSENMSKKSEPKITTGYKGEDFTRITFKPDLARFGMTGIDSDFEALVKKRVYDLAGCIRGIKVYLNDTRLKIKDFKDYAELYVNSATPSTVVGKPQIIYERPNERWEVAFTVSDGQFQQISFVNSICTMKGGTHVSHVADQLVATLIEAAKKKDKKGVPLKPFQVKSHLWIFVNCYIENPAFDSQTKENMTLRQSSFGSKCNISEDFMKKLLKTGVMDNIMSLARFKQDQLLKKTDGHKRTRITGMAKLDDANNAGTRNAHKCTLILTEGDSAKTLAVSGLSVVGRDNYGVFPLRGKLLNVREASHAQITANAEINAIKQILGLQHGKVYTSTDSLRYGHLMIMTDQDHDGSHIKGLIINLLDHFWPSLLQIRGFLLEFITPIVKVTKGAREETFFTIPEYEDWKEKHEDGKGWLIKYYKGLGTSTTQDAKKYFSNMARHMKEFRVSEGDERALIDMAFSKKKADDRKEWLRQFEPGTYMDHTQARIPIEDFINRELILFSMADNARSIPSAIDGLKPGQRKIIFASFKRNLKLELKVAVLAGYVSEQSAYHHGEVSLCSTIVGLAQNFLGSNNLSLLEPKGQFGTRLQGGKDAASARYIFTTLSPLARAIFHPADDALLTYRNDDGQSIEPEWYLPILPMLLINGGEGIGTGWSTSIPNYNPRDVVKNIFRIMDGQSPQDLHPWYRGFQGTIEPAGKDKYKVTGVIRKIDETTVEITELPIKTWTQSYKEDLESWLAGTDKTPAWIQDYKEYHTDSLVHFVVTLSPEQMALAEAEGLEKKFKLTGSLATSNLVCFDQQGRIKKYESIDDILLDFYELRRSFYYKRKAYLLDQLNIELTKVDNKVRFVMEIIKGDLVVQNKKKDVLLQELKQRKYDPYFPNKKIDTTTPEEDDDAEDATARSAKDYGYDYLLSMPIWNLTMEKVQQLVKQRDQKRFEVVELTKLTVNDIWRADLDAFLVQWDAFEAAMTAQDSTRPDNNSNSGDGTSALTKKAPPKKKPVVISDDEDEDEDAMILDAVQDDDDEDDEDEFLPVDRAVALAGPRTTTGRKPPTKTAALAPAAEAAEPVVAPKVRKAATTTRAKKELVPKKERVMDDLATSLSAVAIDTPPEAAAAPKKRALGAKKAVAPGKERASVAKAAPTATATVPVKAEPAASKPARAPAKPRAPKATVVVDSDESEEVIAPVAPKPAARAPAKAQAKPRATKAAVIIDSEDESAEERIPASKPTTSVPTSTARGVRRQPVKYFDPVSDDVESEEPEDDFEGGSDDDDDY
ncbi:DNA topoisomerase [Phlyctochytrium arcticum]|nr:DNA topoisomerase [Phlyctochytrium arcticum]